MAGFIRNSINKITARTYLYEDVIVISTFSGTAFGSIAGAYDASSSEFKDIMINSIGWGIFGSIGGAIVGFTSPLLLPITIIGGTIGLTSYGLEKWKKQ